MNIGGIFFRSPDPAATAAWYERHLGVSLTEPPTIAQMRWRHVDGGSGSTVWAPFPHDTEYFGESGQQYMVNYRVADLAATLSSLRAGDVAVDPRTHRSEAGRFGWATDLDGRRVEL